MRVAAVVLAAGASSRLGSAKQLARLGNENLLERAVRVAREAGCAPVVVVVGASRDAVLGDSRLDDVVTAINDKWEDGMASSIRVGVEALQLCAVDAEGVVLMTCDQPAVTAAHLLEISSVDEMKASRYAGRNGIPAFFAKKYFAELMTLRGDKGARELLATARYVELKSGELDVDTREDLDKARELFG